ncbi:hypothetical protein [Pseudomonas moraviensis]|uniref:Uncharacterized protein n=1 Tax=Pseudomonas moraviensis TaxID=321662 RepID=A0A7Y9W0P9_9PSED|nr:hypothetical protein [Pseudomonas moraviensis]NYH11670.1 hypothetical protein [Pseudomonas moraviensis]
MRITEVSVIKAARDWAAKNDRDASKAVNEAEDAIGKIKSKFIGDQYQKALEGIYQHYMEL